MLETSWTEHMLITPIKPNIFPHSAMPNTRPKGADIMTKSLNVSAIATSAINQKTENGNTGGSGGNNVPAMVDMSKSLASFHLSSSGQTGPAKSRPMDESVDHLFKEGESIAPIEGINFILKISLTLFYSNQICIVYFFILTFQILRDFFKGFSNSFIPFRKSKRSTRTTRQNKTQHDRLPSPENNYRRTQVRRRSS